MLTEQWRRPLYCRGRCRNAGLFLDQFMADDVFPSGNYYEALVGGTKIRIYRSVTIASYEAD